MIEDSEAAALASVAVESVLKTANDGLVLRYGRLESVDVQPDGITCVVFCLQDGHDAWPARVGICFRVTGENDIREAGSLAFHLEEAADSMPESRRRILTESDGDGIAWLRGSEPDRPAIL